MLRRGSIRAECYNYGVGRPVPNMPNFELAKTVSMHASVVLTEDALARLEVILKESGWELSSVDVATTDGHEAKCDSLADVFALPASTWTKAASLTVWARVPGQGFTNLSSITFKKPDWFVFENPVILRIRSNNEELGAAFESRLTEYVRSISKWYTQLSRGLWWNIMMYVSAWSYVPVMLLFKLFDAEPPAYPYTWLIPIGLFLFFTLMTYGGRQFLFPAIRFAIGKGTAAPKK
jgi:hypothetical protein